MRCMTDLLEKLNDAQKKAVTHESGPLLIVAGAGTGKTTVLTRRYLWLMTEKKLTTDEIVALTFTEKASQEMEDRVLEQIPNGAYDFWIHTFHGFCQRILERHGLEIGIPNTFRILTETDAWILLKRRLDELPLDYYRPLGNPVKFLHALIRHMSRAKDEGVTPERYVEFATNAVLDGDSTDILDSERKRLKELADTYAMYQKILRDEGALDFGDVIMETLRLFHERPAVLHKYRQQFKYLLIDEFQDTNWAQYELIKLLAEPQRNITVVGDDDQAIYKFRGASLANILQFKDDYPEAATVALTDNYRSHQHILDTAYKVIGNNNPHRLEISLADQGLSKRLTSKADSAVVDAGVSIEWFSSLEQEAAWVADDIVMRHGAESKDKGWSKFAILVRANDQALPFVDALAARNVPYRFFALRGLYAKPVIVDLMALLKLSVHAHDSAAAWRVISLPSFEVPLSAIQQALAYSARKGLPLWEALKQSPVYLNQDPDGARAVQKAVAVMEKLAETARREPPLAVLHQALNASGYLSRILSLPERERVEAIGLLNEFVGRIRRFEANAHAPYMIDFVVELEMEIQSGEEGSLKSDAEAGPDVVRIMTIHASKGLEFESVYLVSLVDQRFPTRERQDAIPLPDGLVKERLQEGDVHIQEERRLCYVAMTRAKTNLILTGADDYGGARKKKPSMFLGETGIDVPAALPSEADDPARLKPNEKQADEKAAWREVFQLKRRFSFTQLVAYKKCPLQYKFAHVYRVPVLGSHNKSFGQSIHLALQQILKRHLDRIGAQQGDLFTAPKVHASTEGGLLVNEDEALEIFKQSWIDEWYKTRIDHDKFYAQGREAILRMWHAWAAHPPLVKALEADFDWRIGEHSIKGKIDRVDDLGDGAVAILDYKTSEHKEGDKADALDREQLWLYQLAMEARGQRVGRLAYLFVRTPGAESQECAALEVPLLKDEDKLDFQEQLTKRMDEILLSDFPPTPSQHLCQYCDFKNVCEFRK